MPTLRASDWRYFVFYKYVGPTGLVSLSSVRYNADYNGFRGGRQYDNGFQDETDIPGSPDRI
ncbi:MAG: hypothetical protein DRI57_05660 [Deltaproteobacteria bacterium]|nr:MAG: hypothetical protein DRI57_05660 [Deltaproteobacteria bacterium]